MARVSNTQSPRLSVQWIDAAKAAHFHVSLNTFRQVQWIDAAKAAHFMSALTHSDQVFLGFPLLLALGITILVPEIFF